MDDTNKPELSAKLIAHQILAWAKKGRMFGASNNAPDFNDKLINEIFAPAGVRNATIVFQDRGISYIGINEVENSIQIFLNKPPRYRDKQFFSKLGKSGVPISVLGGGMGHASNRIPSPVNVQPSTFRGPRYTCGSSIYLATESGGGTLGCLVCDTSGTVYGLSNNHVTGSCNYAELTLPIQIGGWDGR